MSKIPAIQFTMVVTMLLVWLNGCCASQSQTVWSVDPDRSRLMETCNVTIKIGVGHGCEAMLSGIHERLEPNIGVQSHTREIIIGAGTNINYTLTRVHLIDLECSPVKGSLSRSCCEYEIVDVDCEIR